MQLELDRFLDMARNRFRLINIESCEILPSWESSIEACEELLKSQNKSVPAWHHTLVVPEFTKWAAQGYSKATNSVDLSKLRKRKAPSARQVLRTIKFLRKKPEITKMQCEFSRDPNIAASII